MEISKYHLQPLKPGLSFFLYIIVIAVVLFISVSVYIHRDMGKGLCIREKFHDCVEEPLNNYDTGNDNSAKKQVDDQVKAGNEIENDKDSRVLFDFASESLKKKLPPTDEFQYCYEGQSTANEKGKGESGRNCNDIKERESPTDETDLNDDKEKPASSISGSYHDLQQLENEEDKEKSTEIFVDANESFQQIINEIDETDLNDDKEKPAGSISGSNHDLQQLENEEDKEESTYIDDTFESLQQIPPEIAYPIKSSDIARNEDTYEQQQFLKNTPESPRTMTHKDENIPEARRNDENVVKKQPVLGIKVEGASTSENPPTMRQDDGNIAEARRSGNSDASNPADMNESDSSEKFEDALSSPTIIKHKNSEVSREKHKKGDSDGLRTIEVDSNTCKSAEVDISKDLKEEVSTAEKPDNKEGYTQEPTNVFDDTVESLQRIAHPTDEQDRELCSELYSLLDTEGRKLTQGVMAATITRETGKPVKILLNNLTVQEKNKLKAMLPEESHRIFESKTEHDNSIHVSYGLHRIILDEENSPKSGWGNPVRGTDIGIGDDIERLYSIQTIVKGISNPVTVSVDSYIRLLDIMIKALIRLDPYAEFKEDYKQLSYKLESIKNPNLTQTMLKRITDFVKKYGNFKK